jgi:acyl-CoA reductase-like NAD-dependent aldehyde dehydrogenase
MEAQRQAPSGPARPAAGDGKTCFPKTDVFTEVTPKMTIAQDGISGPVLSAPTVDSFEQAVEVANGRARDCPRRAPAGSISSPSTRCAK